MKRLVAAGVTRSASIFEKLGPSSQGTQAVPSGPRWAWTDSQRGFVTCSQPERSTRQGWKAVKSLCKIQTASSRHLLMSCAGISSQLARGQGKYGNPSDTRQGSSFAFGSFDSALMLSSASVSWRSTGRAMSGRDMPVPWDCCILCVILKIRMFAQENNVDCVENVASAVPQVTVPKNRPWTRELENKPEYSILVLSLSGGRTGSMLTQRHMPGYTTFKR